jgi:uncharacterized protein
MPHVHRKKIRYSFHFSPGVARKADPAELPSHHRRSQVVCPQAGQPSDIVAHAMRGTIFETFIFSELFKSFAHRGETPPLFFWRDRTGHEIDIVIDASQMLIPLEVKSGQMVVPSFFDGLRFFCALGAPASKTGVLIHGGGAAYERQDSLVLPWFLAG